ncbi:cytochrome c oxidase subunit NDUFA4 isoform X1 [Tursiops truncatus]|uniref:cytochrome c oxidase subunit NDUFA4 isoform X1 n=1 Tax=Tursiops truncatus TaxID=9739 RepID=UPI003CCF35F2
MIRQIIGQAKKHPSPFTVPLSGPCLTLSYSAGCPKTLSSDLPGLALRGLAWHTEVDPPLPIYWSGRYWSSTVCFAPGVVQSRCQLGQKE